MEPENLLQELNSFSRSRRASVLCRRYGVQIEETLGELFLRLSVRAQLATPIRDPRAWVRTNAAGYLRNHLRTEHRRLRQGTRDF
jgi:DNA-directed RNA polymerase specialized sigma24 family protein